MERAPSQNFTGSKKIVCQSSVITYDVIVIDMGIQDRMDKW